MYSTKEHLKVVNVFQTCVSFEKKLILARIGLLGDYEGHDFTICLRYAGGYQQRAQISEPGPSRELLNQSQTEQESEIFLSRGRMYQNVTVIFTDFQKHLYMGRHKLKLKKISTFDKVKRK